MKEELSPVSSKKKESSVRRGDASPGVKDARPDRYTKAEAILTTLIRLCAWIIRLIITWNLQQSHWKTTQTFDIGT